MYIYCKIIRSAPGIYKFLHKKTLLNTRDLFIDGFKFFDGFLTGFQFLQRFIIFLI